MIDAEWVTGLDAPKGSAIGGDKLYVADLTKLRIVDLASGAFETYNTSRFRIGKLCATKKLPGSFRSRR